MNRFERVIQILDQAVGGPASPVGFPHRAFWRGVTRDEFVAKKVIGLALVTIGNGAGSNLVKALRGETPFGADTGNPDADFSRMPAGLPPVPPAEIAFIEKWIDDGCLEDELDAVTPLTWRKTNAPVASSRTDDIWFLDPITGWAVNSDGKILKTVDGGKNWAVQFTAPNAYLRCVGFANASLGWVGTLSRNRRMFQTRDGGATWSRVTPLPALAPVKVCGLSVVSASVVYASGTNDPADVPRMMKTVDGGATWTAWDMSAHASILIDTFFTDALHGWAVGGKANQPTPTTRDKVKPVVLETSDGGLTWTNRFDGDGAEFGEWGWKIQFLDGNTGFVSLENFDRGAILKTVDGGRTWQRQKVNDPQGNANLEGIGFIDEKRGWVGGWGDRNFAGGFSSATEDGGLTWRNANEIGRFLNRFRFFGKPVHTGYASGDTVYKYSSEPVGANLPIHSLAGDLTRALLPDVAISASLGNIAVRMNIPAGAQRLSLLVWGRFGEEMGCVLDEINPAPGPRVFVWDGADAQGNAIAPGDYIIRLIADASTASSILSVTAAAPNRLRTLAASATGDRAFRRLPGGMARMPRLLSMAELVAEPKHDIDWLHDSLQLAAQLELATLPPYLTARWSIKKANDPVANSIKEIRGEEMLHFGLACNLLTAIGGAPLIAHPSVVPTYPGPLPGGVRPGLQVALRKLTRDQAGVFMDIEYPQGGPVALAADAAVTIGQFYEAILAAFEDLLPPLGKDRQVESSVGGSALFKIDSIAKVREAIQLINVQGEGSRISPEEKPGDLAHFYRFAEIYHGRRFVKNAEGKWGFTGPEVPLPETHDMADIPTGGYQQADAPDQAVWELIQRFDREYSQMLRLLENTWIHGDAAILGDAIGAMLSMGNTGRELIKLARPDGRGNYGPCFRLVSEE